MIEAREFIDAATHHGFWVYSGVPCSYLTPLINGVINSDLTRYIGAVNEGDAVAIASGAELAGRRSVVMLQNSGLGNAVNPLSSLNQVFRIPILLIVTHRGEPGGAPDEPQHELMGRATIPLLDLLAIPHEPFPEDGGDIAPALQRAVASMDATGAPYALVMKKGSVSAFEREVALLPKRATHARTSGEEAVPERLPSRRDVLHAAQRTLEAGDVVVATTGYTGRELFSLEDRDCQIYMVGSMGCAAGLALGIAVAQPHRRTMVLDGDGALLMRLGSLATIGHEAPSNLVHVLLDNGCHESTGGQPTVSGSLDIPAIAAACGYRHVRVCATPEDVVAALRSGRETGEGPCFIHVRTSPGVTKPLPRPSMSPKAAADRFRAYLRTDAGEAVTGSEAPTERSPGRGGSQ